MHKFQEWEEESYQADLLRTLEKEDDINLSGKSQEEAWCKTGLKDMKGMEKKNPKLPDVYYPKKQFRTRILN